MTSCMLMMLFGDVIHG